MKTPLRILSVLLLLVAVVASLWFGPLTSRESRELGADLLRFDERLRSTEGLALSLDILNVEGLPDALADRRLDLTANLPRRVRLETQVDGKTYRLGRDGGTLWVEVPHKELAIAGHPDVPRFTGLPNSVDAGKLPDWNQPIPRWQLALLPAVVQVEKQEGETQRYLCRPRPAFAKWVGWPGGLDLYFEKDETDSLKAIEGKIDEKKLRLGVASVRWMSSSESDAVAWAPPATKGKTVERVALSHLLRFARVGLDNLGKRITPLPPADGSRILLAEHGKGRLEQIDGTRVLFLEGSASEMGEQHGVLLKDEIKNLVDRIVYGVGIGSTFGKGRWFFGEIEEAQRRLEPFIDPRHLREMDAIAAAAGMHPREIRLANFFPELFHCSGFALHGSATVDGRIYHGRILDYLRGLGLEQNAVVMVVKPEHGNAWVNVGYAGFVGTVTAMNEKQIAIGEMGGRGEGNWDGKPMAQLMREVMEHADTIDEAVEIMRKGPRTCEYYYVISDAKSGRAVGIKATPDLFETIWSGESHPQLTRPVKDTVLLSAGERYETLVDRVEEGFGKFDAAAAIGLMEKPVCMNSNIQSVLFAPDTLDFWVANADSDNVASHTRYTRYNLRDLLEREEQHRPPVSSPSR